LTFICRSPKLNFELPVKMKGSFAK